MKCTMPVGRNCWIKDVTSFLEFIKILNFLQSIQVSTMSFYQNKRNSNNRGTLDSILLSF